MNTTTLKSNAKLASELKKLGFTRGICSWEKSDFRKSIKTQSWLGTTAIVRVDVSIRNRAIRGNDWVINRVSLSTKNLSSDKGFVNGQVDLTADAQAELFELLAAVRGL